MRTEFVGPSVGAELARRYGETSKEVLHAIAGGAAARPFMTGLWLAGAWPVVGKIGTATVIESRGKPYPFQGGTNPFLDLLQKFTKKAAAPAVIAEVTARLRARC